MSPVATPIPADRVSVDSTDTSAVRHFAAVLRQHGYSGAAVPRALGNQIGKFHFRRDLPLYLRRLNATTALNALIKLFALEQALDESEFRQALPELSLNALKGLGVVEQVSGAIVPLVKLCAYSDLLLAHDLSRSVGAAPSADHVLGVGAATVTLDSLTVRGRATRALDLGTGCGVQALLAARHCDHVVGTDKNARALDFACFNAHLNDISNVTFHEGSFFEPVHGERFDLVVSNPPYVISPESTYIFRDGGEPGDTLCESLVRAIPNYLSAGGYATILCNWVVDSPDKRDARPRGWMDTSVCDALVLVCDVQDSLTYSAIWNREDDEATYSKRIDQWRAYFAAAGIPAIGMGALILRGRTAGPGWVHGVEVAANPTDSCHEQIVRMFAARDVLNGTDAGLRRRTVRLAREHRCAQTFAWRDEACAVEAVRLELGHGLKFSVPIDLATMKFIALLGSGRTLGDAIRSFADDVEEPVNAVEASLLSITRTLLAYGFAEIGDVATTSQEEHVNTMSGFWRDAGEG